MHEVFRLLDEHFHHSRFEEALALCDGVMGPLEKSGRSVESAGLAAYRANALTAMGRYAEALGECDRAEPILAEHFGEGSVVVACCRNQRAHTYLRIGLFSDAIANWERAVEIFDRNREARGAALSRGAMAGAYARIGRLETAEDDCRGAIDKLREMGGEVDVARIRINLGNVLIRMGRGVDALEQYALAEQAFLRSGLHAELAACRSLKSFAYYTTRDYENVVAECDRAEPGLGGIALARARHYRALALQEQGRHGESIAIFESIEAAFAPVSEEDRQRFYVGFGDALWDAGRRDEALGSYTKARRLLRRARRLAGIDVDSPEFVAERLTVARRSVGRALDAGRTRLAFEAVQDGKAGILGDYRDTDAPAEVVDVGMHNLVRRVRENLCRWLHHERDERIGRRLDGLADASGDQEGQVREAVEGALEEELERETMARTEEFLTTWSTAHRDARATGAGQTGRERLPLPSDEPAGLEQVQAALPPRWALLDFWISNDEQASVFVVTRGDLRVVALPLRAEDRVKKAVG